jgi:hypothetical protein
MKPPDNPTLAPLTAELRMIEAEMTVHVESEWATKPRSEPDRLFVKVGIVEDWRNRIDRIRRMLEGGRNAGGTGPRDVDSMARPVAESSGNGGAVPDIADPVVAEDTPEKLIADMLELAADTINPSYSGIDRAARWKMIAARVEALFAREREWRQNAISGHIRATQSALDQLAAMTAERDDWRKGYQEFKDLATELKAERDRLRAEMEEWKKIATSHLEGMNILLKRVSELEAQLERVERLFLDESPGGRP